jgi:hypothetical protein
MHLCRPTGAAQTFKPTSEAKIPPGVPPPAPEIYWHGRNGRPGREKPGPQPHTQAEGQVLTAQQPNGGAQQTCTRPHWMADTSRSI